MVEKVDFRTHNLSGICISSFCRWFVSLGIGFYCPALADLEPVIVLLGAEIIGMYHHTQLFWVAV